MPPRDINAEPIAPARERGRIVGGRPIISPSDIPFFPSGEPPPSSLRGLRSRIGSGEINPARPGQTTFGTKSPPGGVADVNAPVVGSPPAAAPRAGIGNLVGFNIRQFLLRAVEASGVIGESLLTLCSLFPTQYKNLCGVIRLGRAGPANVRGPSAPPQRPKTQDPFKDLRQIQERLRRGGQGAGKQRPGTGGQIPPSVRKIFNPKDPFKARLQKIIPRVVPRLPAPVKAPPKPAPARVIPAATPRWGLLRIVLGLGLIGGTAAFRRAKRSRARVSPALEPGVIIPSTGTQRPVDLVSSSLTQRNRIISLALQSSAGSIVGRARDLAPAGATAATQACIAECARREKRRAAGRCREGFFKETRRRTRYTTWREYDCRTGKTIFESK